MRFYPDAVPPFQFEPTTDRFRIQSFENDRGEGVVSLTSFDPGDAVAAFSGVVLPHITQFTLQLSESLHIHDPYFMGKVLHHCDPNCITDLKRLLFIATKRIEPGEIITIDYDATEDVLFKPFHCSCGAARCRGFIQGRAAKP